MIRNEAISVQAVSTAHGVLSCRPEDGTDEPFLFSLFESVKGPDFAGMPVDARMKAQLLDMQYRAMTQAYRAGFPAAVFAVVMMDDVPIGRLIIDITEDRIHVVYIALLSQWRCRGVGSALMRAVLTNAHALGLACEAVVAVNNIPSRRLWTGLGFTERVRNAADVVMEWRS